MSNTLFLINTMSTINPSNQNLTVLMRAEIVAHRPSTACADTDVISTAVIHVDRTARYLD